MWYIPYMDTFKSPYELLKTFINWTITTYLKSRFLLLYYHRMKCKMICGELNINSGHCVECKGAAVHLLQEVLQEWWKENSEAHWKKAMGEIRR